jgi:hypothetical protein
MKARYEKAEDLNRKLKISLTASGLLAATFAAINPAAAESDIQESIASEEPSFWSKARKKIRSRTFTEFMTPAVDNHGGYIPLENGDPLLPANAFNIIWADYEIAKDTKIVYWQRSNLNFAPTPTSGGAHVSLVPRNPRFALRKVNVFDVPNLSTTYDVYIQPGLAPEAASGGRDLEFGFRTATSYSIPGSRWSLGAISETTVAPLFRDANPRAGSSNFYGWLMSWASYDLSKTFSTQHYVTVSFQHVREKQWIEADYPMPLAMQNGFGVNISESVWAAAFINNYLNTLPTLANTWASVWLAVTFL